MEFILWVKELEVAVEEKDPETVFPTNFGCPSKYYSKNIQYIEKYKNLKIVLKKGD